VIIGQPRRFYGVGRDPYSFNKQIPKPKEIIMSSKILVTGATGNVGSKVVEQLSAAGIAVRAAVQSTSKATKIKSAGVEPVEFDFTRPETLPAAFDGVEKVFLLTPFVPNMVELGLRAVNAAKKAGVKYIVRLSAMGANFEPSFPLGHWHREVEKAVESSKIPYTILRPNSFMQNYSTALSGDIKTQSAFYLPMGDAKLSVIDTRDIAFVAAELLRNPGHEGQTYELTGPDALSNYDVAEILSKVTGRKINYISVPEEGARKGMKDAGMPDWTIDALNELFAVQRAGKMGTVSSAVERITKRKPISFSQFAVDHLAAFK
jgi:uncharacterized protein YbjT (DUF2867 family)